MKILLLIVLVSISNCLAQEPHKCGNFDRLNETRGMLDISRSVPECGYLTLDDNRIFGIRTDNLLLQPGDMLKFSSERNENVITLKPPFEKGYIISGVVEPKITFTFGQTDNTTRLQVEFFQNTATVPINGDINNNFQIQLLNQTGMDLDLLIEKNSTDLAFLEIEGALINGTSKQQFIQNGPVRVKLSASKDIIKVKTTIGSQSCSGILAPDNSNGFSITGPQKGPCYWNLTSDKNIDLTFSSNNIAPSGCLSIQSLVQGKQIYNRCNLTSSDILPTFTLKHAYISLSLPENNTYIDATVSPSREKIIIQDGRSNKFDIISTKYPVSYSWQNETIVQKLNATKKNFVISIVDVDLRDGEELKVGQAIVNNLTQLDIGDLTVSDKVVNVTVSRSIQITDFSLHRGFKLTVTPYNQILLPNSSTTHIELKKANQTSAFVKISVPNPTKFKRISFNISIQQSLVNSSVNDYTVTLYDGRSLLSKLVDDLAGFNGSTTSDTLLISYRTKKPNTFLPPMSIEYKTLDCDIAIGHICDNETRCVPFEKLCKGVSYCADGSDIKLPCSSGPLPNIIASGFGGFTVFVLCILMLSIGALGALYGPGIFKTLEDRFRSGQYTTFSSTE